MTNDQIQEILKAHKMWLDSAGEKGERADLYGADLYEADLSRADLSRADLREADLRGANLYGADLSRADLRGAELRGADLREANLREANLSRADLSRAHLREANLYGADLRGADLYGADLYEADLSRADLRGAELYGADLREADLRGADLRGADLYGADLSGTHLRGANLYGADLRGAKNIPYVPMACPSDGSFIGWKKAHNMIVKLQIPEDAKRSSATGRKCRCDKAIVLAIETLNGSPVFFKEASPFLQYAHTGVLYDINTGDAVAVRSDFDNCFVYRIGETVSVDNFDTDRFNECAPGIHFFIDRQEAVDY